MLTTLRRCYYVFKCFSFCTSIRASFRQSWYVQERSSLGCLANIPSRARIGIIRSALNGGKNGTAHTRHIRNDHSVSDTFTVLIISWVYISIWSSMVQTHIPTKKVETKFMFLWQTVSTCLWILKTSLAEMKSFFPFLTSSIFFHRTFRIAADLFLCALYHLLTPSAALCAHAIYRSHWALLPLNYVVCRSRWMWLCMHLCYKICLYVYTHASIYGEWWYVHVGRRKSC